VNSSAYDNSGNQTTIGGYSYAYDAENRMVGAYLYAGATVQSNTAYVYDGMGAAGAEDQLRVRVDSPLHGGEFVRDDHDVRVRRVREPGS
jgi:hypothetical protein